MRSRERSGEVGFVRASRMFKVATPYLCVRAEAAMVLLFKTEAVVV